MVTISMAGDKSSDTIVALATPKGSGAIAIVRLSGEEAIAIAANVVQHGEKLRRQKSHSLHLVDLLLEDGSLLDRVLCAVYRSPASYTGEDSVEFFLHGGTYIAAKTIERCCQSGAQIAEPGEFTLRAFLNGRMDLAQAEAVADLVAAKSALSHRAAMLQRGGALSGRIRLMRDELLTICAMVELEIDFSDQDVPVLDRESVQDALAKIWKDLKSLEESFKRGRLAREGATVAIAGAPNVGKSSLFNALLGEDRAIVDETPGTTRDAVEAVVDWQGLSVRLVDTAGQTELFAGADAKAVQRSRHATREADLVLWVLDLSNPRSGEPPGTLGGDRTVIVGNKVDIADRSYDISSYDLRTCATSGLGVEAVKQAIFNRLAGFETIQLDEGVLTRERHLVALRKGLESLEKGRAVLRDGLGEELLSLDLREAVDHLGEIIGEIVPEDVLNRIFADFCIGK